MTLGEKLRQARLEAGLSQRALCGEQITRNMLSQIENGAAKPSMETLLYLAHGVGKPVSYFLEEDVVLSPNPPVLEQAQAALVQGESALGILESYAAGDKVFDSLYYFLLSEACYREAERALLQEKVPYAGSLLEKTLEAGEKTLYPYPKTQALALEAWIGRKNPETLRENLDRLEKVLGPWKTRMALLLARDCLNNADPQGARFYLKQAEEDQGEKQILLGESYFQERNFSQAAKEFQKAEELAPKEELPSLYDRLEICFRELEDYKEAYHYAALQKA